MGSRRTVVFVVNSLVAAGLFAGGFLSGRANPRIVTKTVTRVEIRPPAACLAVVAAGERLKAALLTDDGRDGSAPSEIKFAYNLGQLAGRLQAGTSDSGVVDAAVGRIRIRIADAGFDSAAAECR